MEKMYLTNEQLVAAIQGGKKDLMQELLDKNAPLIKSIIREVTSGYNLIKEDYEDIEQICKMEIFDAISKYEASQNTKFMTYAAIILRRKIKDWLRHNCTLIVISKDMRTLCSRYKNVEEKYINEHDGKHPCDEYFLKELKINEEMLKEIYRTLILYNIESTDADNFEEKAKDDEDIVLTQSIEDDESKEIEAAINGLNEKAQRVIFGKFYKNEKLVDIAREMGVTPGRVQNIIRNGMRKLSKDSRIQVIAQGYGINTAKTE